ncbi:MAG: hypothetical protein ABIJ92_02895 [Candidatus Aenigmatarchaeota archaeon]
MGDLPKRQFSDKTLITVTKTTRERFVNQAEKLLALPHGIYNVSPVGFPQQAHPGDLLRYSVKRVLRRHRLFQPAGNGEYTQNAFYAALIRDGVADLAAISVFDLDPEIETGIASLYNDIDIDKIELGWVDGKPVEAPPVQHLAREHRKIELEYIKKRIEHPPNVNPDDDKDKMLGELGSRLEDYHYYLGHISLLSPESYASYLKDLRWHMTMANAIELKSRGILAHEISTSVVVASKSRRGKNGLDPTELYFHGILSMTD